MLVSKAVHRAACRTQGPDPRGPLGSSASKAWSGAEQRGPGQTPPPPPARENAHHSGREADHGPPAHHSPCATHHDTLPSPRVPAPPAGAAGDPHPEGPSSAETTARKGSVIPRVPRRGAETSSGQLGLLCPRPARSVAKAGGSWGGSRKTPWIGRHGCEDTGQTLTFAGQGLSCPGYRGGEGPGADVGRRAELSKSGAG